jgi:putative hydrolases of HD superfamily
MEEIQKFRLFNKLKAVYRLNSVQNRKESVAEHSWSSLILADFFISKYYSNLDRLKVYELLMYHDVVEIETGDTPLHPEMKRLDKKEKESKAKELLHETLPNPLNNKFSSLFVEFVEQKTLESKFVKAIDALDPMIHELDYKEDWQGWSEEFLIEKKLKFFEEFPEMKEVFFEILEYMKTNNYFEK